MKRARIYSWRSIFHLIAAVGCMVFLFACDNGNASDQSETGAGTLSFKAVYLDTAENHQTSAAAIDCAGQSAATVEAHVYGPDNTLLAGGGPWDCDAGQGTIQSVPAGDERTVVILGKNAEKNVVFRGETGDIQVVADSESNAGIIDCYSFIPVLQAPLNETVVNTDIMGLAWNTVSGAAYYRVIISESDDLSAPVIDDTAYTTNYKPSDLIDSQTYYRQVAANDAQANSGSGSEIWSFTVEDPIDKCKLPDTGQTATYTDTFGEDSDYTINPPAYTKLDASGKELNADTNVWAMVRDDVTGLIWEAKSDANDIHQTQDSYNWQDAKRIFIDALSVSFNYGFIDSRKKTNSYYVRAVCNAP